MTESKKEWFRDHVRGRVVAELGQSLDELDDIRRSDWMTRVYVEEVLLRLYPGALPDDLADLAGCYTDGWADGGCDFICRHDGIVTIIQAKYRGKSASEAPEKFDEFADVLARLHPKLGAKVPKNDAVKDIIADINWEQDQFDLQFITLGKVNEAMRAREARGQAALTEIRGISERVDLTLIDEQGLNERLRDAESTSQGVNRPVDLLFTPPAGQETPWFTYESSTGRRAWVGLVSARHLSNLRHFRNRLFALNIRNYIGDNKTNAQIKQTATNEPENFFFYNNGIAAVATRVTPNADRATLQCEHFSIINGAQTFRSLIKAHAATPATAGDAQVLIRVTEVALRAKTADQAFIDNVTQFNNTQNPVRISDFRSNDAVQRQLNKRFQKLSRKGGKQYSYKNKRTGDRERNTIAIGMEEFAQTLFSFRVGPPDVYGGKQHLFDTSPEGGYAKVFGEDGEVWEGLTDEQFTRLAGEWFFCAEARDAMDSLKKQAIERASEEQRPAVKAALERRWMVYFTLGALVEERYRRAKADPRVDIARLSTPKWLDEEEDGLLRSAVRSYCLGAREVLIRVYRSAQKQASFVQRNWYRSESTLSDIRDDVQNADSLVDGLPLLRGGAAG